MIRTFLALCLLVPAAAHAVEPLDGERIAAGQYLHCLKQIEVNPDDAYDMAIAWRDIGGGMPAQHCAAMALVALKLYPEAAVRFEMLAREPGSADASLRAEILAQAGNAWTLAKRPHKAVDAFNEALNVLEQDTDETRETEAAIRLDRARLLVLGEEVEAARPDVEAVLSFDGIPDKTRAEALALRSDLWREAGQIDKAIADATQAITLSPEAGPAYLARGRALALQGDRDGARHDFLVILQGSSRPDLAEAARTALQQLDIHN